NLEDTIVTLANGATVTYTVTIPIPSNLTQIIINTVEVTSDTPSDNNVCIGCTSYAAPKFPITNIVTTKTATTPTYTYYGIDNVQSITYYLQVGNNGVVTAENVEVQTTLPEGVIPASVSWSGNGTSGTGSIQDIITTLEPGEIITYQITAPINAGFNASHILTSANVTVTVQEDEEEEGEIDVTYLLTNWAYTPGNDL